MTLNLTTRHSFNQNTLTLHVKKSPPLGRIFILFLAFIAVALPIMGMVFRFMDGGSFHFGFIIGLGAFSLISFYFMRLFLWNTYGKEVITIGETTVSYYVDYHYFKGNQQEIRYETLVFKIEKVGFEEEQLGRLIIEASDKELILSSVNMELKELEEIIKQLTIIELEIEA